MTIDVWQIDLAAPESEFELGWLDAQERARLKAFRSTDVQRRFARSHAALRGILAGYVAAPPHALRFATGLRGKPSLPGRNLHFNLAHSGEAALVAVSRAAPVGVDVEQPRPLHSVLGMARTVFHAEEIAQLEALDPSQRHEAFFECWVRREALVKGLGLGLAGAGSVGPAWRSGVAGAILAEDWRIEGLEIEAPYRAAVAAQAPAFRVHRRSWPPPRPGVADVFA